MASGAWRSQSLCDYDALACSGQPGSSCASTPSNLSARISGGTPDQSCAVLVWQAWEHHQARVSGQPWFGLIGPVRVQRLERTVEPPAVPCIQCPGSEAADRPLHQSSVHRQVRTSSPPFLPVVPHDPVARSSRADTKAREIDLFGNIVAEDQRNFPSIGLTDVASTRTRAASFRGRRIAVLRVFSWIGFARGFIAVLTITSPPRRSGPGRG